MNFVHKKLAEGRWYNLSFFEQMANIGLEVERAINWKKKNNIEYSRKAIERALELLYLTIEDTKNKKHLKELTRLREFLIDYFYLDNYYSFSEEFWHKYFYHFICAVRIKRENKG